MKAIILLSHLLPQSLQQKRGCYKKVYNFYKSAQFWSKEKIELWQLNRLKKIITYAYENISGYRQLYEESGIHPNDITELKDIKYIPFVDKALLRDNSSEFIPSQINKKKLYHLTTGGSTGIPFGFYVDKKNGSAEYGFMYNAWETIGWTLNDTGIILRGGFVGNENHFFEKAGFHRYNLSSYYLTERNYNNYKNFLLKLKPSFLHAYPSSATELANFVIKFNDIGEITFKHIFLGSENLYDWQKDIIKSAFPSAKIMCWYGHTERAIWAPWCEQEEKYHINPFYGFTEIIGKNDQEVKQGEIGELVGTSFWMFGTPFIRYRTMDFAYKGKYGCEKCGRNFQLIDQIDGRLSEIIISKTGRRISMTAINMHDETFDEIEQFRFIQFEPGLIQLSIVPKQNFTPDHKIKIEKSIQNKLGNDFELKINIVDKIPRSKSGKYSFLEQHLNIERSDRLIY